MEQTTGSATAKAVLLVLAEAADSRHTAYPSQRRICDVTELRERAVRDALKSLESACLISRKAQYRKGGSRKSDLYRLNIPAGNAGSIPAPDAGMGTIAAADAGKGGSIPAPDAALVPTVLEPEDIPPVGPPADAVAERRTPRRSKRCPDWWEPNDAHRQLAQELGVNFGLEIAKLRDHEFDRPKSDWDATARNWLRKAAEMNPKRQTSGNLMITPFNAERREEPRAPVKTRMQIEHEERIRRAVGR